MAVSWRFLSAFNALAAAPVPRPPQPMRPTFSVPLPAACTPAGNSNELASEPVAMAAVDCLRNARREGEVLCEAGRRLMGGNSGRGSKKVVAELAQTRSGAPEKRD